MFNIIWEIILQKIYIFIEVLYEDEVNNFYLYMIYDRFKNLNNL